MGRPRKSQTIIREPFDAESTIDGKALKEIAKEAAIEASEKRAKYDTIKNLNAFTKSTFYLLNHLIHEFKGLSPEASDWYVSIYYPTSKDGPVYIDFPKTDRQKRLCEKKAEVMKKLKNKYLVFLPDEMPTEERFEEGEF